LPAQPSDSAQDDHNRGSGPQSGFTTSRSERETDLWQMPLLQTQFLLANKAKLAKANSEIYIY
jgi:hypothetical protein